MTPYNKKIPHQMYLQYLIELIGTAYWREWINLIKGQEFWLVYYSFQVQTPNTGLRLDRFFEHTPNKTYLNNPLYTSLYIIFLIIRTI